MQSYTANDINMTLCVYGKLLGLPEEAVKIKLCTK